MRVLISGGTGMIGSELARFLLAEGHEVWILTRKSSGMTHPGGVKYVPWDGRSSLEWKDGLDEVDAVVNLIGERLAKWPWSASRKQVFWDSRVKAGQALAEAIGSASRRPRVFLQASGANYYGPHGTERVDESFPAGNDFLGRLSLAWEDSTRSLEASGVRRIILRSGIVLSAKSGILPIMMLPIRFFVGGPLGDGNQGIPWIHVSDEVEAIRFLLGQEKASGPYNLTSPRSISSSDFLHQLCRALRRPYWLRVPAFALRLVLGEMSDLLLKGVYLVPQRLQDLGYRFKFENAQEAFLDLLSPGTATGRKAGV